jgi:hypothetical protein
MKISNTRGQDPDAEKLALSIADVVRASGLCRTLIFSEIRSGRLVARKCGRRTVVLHDDLVAFLQALPLSGSAAKPQSRDGIQ